MKSIFLFISKNAKNKLLNKENGNNNNIPINTNKNITFIFYGVIYFYIKNYIIYDINYN